MTPSYLGPNLAKTRTPAYPKKASGYALKCRIILSHPYNQKHHQRHAIKNEYLSRLPRRLWIPTAPTTTDFINHLHPAARPQRQHRTPPARPYTRHRTRGSGFVTQRTLRVSLIAICHETRGSEHTAPSPARKPRRRPQGRAGWPWGQGTVRPGPRAIGRVARFWHEGTRGAIRTGESACGDWQTGFSS